MKIRHHNNLYSISELRRLLEYNNVSKSSSQENKTLLTQKTDTRMRKWLYKLLGLFIRLRPKDQLYPMKIKDTIFKIWNTLEIA